MLTITVGAIESWDQELNEFTSSGGVVLGLEHSLASLSKWESIHCKPFISDDDRTDEEWMDYVRCMIVTPYSPEDLYNISAENFNEINEYINSSQTATWFRERKGQGGKGRVVTAELIYYWMLQHGIPMECQYWHLNRLTTLIKVANEESQPPKPVDKRTAMAQRREMNAARRKQLGTRG